MFARFRWPLLLGAFSVALSLLMQGPQWIHMADPRYQGVLVPLNSDEEIYQARVEEALQGRPEQAAEALIGDPALRGGQAAQIEAFEGMLFQWTGWSAPMVFQFLDSIIPVLLFLALWFFLRRCGFTKKQAFVGAVLFCILELYNLNRPVYQRESVLLSLATFLLLIEGIERRWIFGILGGVLLGATTGGYLWGWTYQWLWAGLMLAFVCIDHWQSPGRGVMHYAPTGRPGLRWAVFMVIAILAAIPSVITIWQMIHHPAYADTHYRSGIHSSHLPESWPYTIIFLILGMSVLWMWFRHRHAIIRYRYGIVTVLAGAVALNQQLVHGITFNFASHYLFVLILAAIIVVLLAWSMQFRPRWILLPCAAAVLYLVAIGYDGSGALISQWTPRESRFSEQNFFTVLPILDALPRGRILSDPETSLFLAATTKHDVVYALYLKNVLISHEELADRFCATQLSAAPEDRHLEERKHLIWPDANGAFGESARTEELRLVGERCAMLDDDPPAAMRRFGVDYVLWDKTRQPDWQPDRLQIPLTEVATGSGWVLWRVR